MQFKPSAIDTIDSVFAKMIRTDWGNRGSCIYCQRNTSVLIPMTNYTLLKRRQSLLSKKLAPCQWGSRPDCHVYKLMINYSMIIELVPIVPY